MEKPEKNTSPASNALDYLRDLVSILSGVLLVLLLLLRVVVVSGPSMKNTLIDGDYILLLSNVFYTEPTQGDIVVASKNSFKNGEPIIKRIIATEGQEVDIDFDAGMVYVDGVALDEPYTLTDTNLEEGVQFPLTVNDGCVFVMGDNRNESKDSRNPEIGQIDCREIVGKAVFLLFPGSNKNTVKRDFGRIGVLS
ncbi:MAG: signal peptidase I [Oscillospiraceae bacterium]|nr:signal peptidase I [Oscillospiraceae bacterium]